MGKVRSVEPNIADLVNGWLKKYKLDYKLEQEALNSSIDKALNERQVGNIGGLGIVNTIVRLTMTHNKNLKYDIYNDNGMEIKIVVGE